jgi:hypothetical protein
MDSIAEELTSFPPANFKALDASAQDEALQAFVAKLPALINEVVDLGKKHDAIQPAFKVLSPGGLTGSMRCAARGHAS